MPSKSVQKEYIDDEHIYAKMTKKRLEEKRKHEREMAELDAQVKEREQRDAAHQEETRYIINQNSILRKELMEEK